MVLGTQPIIIYFKDFNYMAVIAALPETQLVFTEVSKLVNLVFSQRPRVLLSFHICVMRYRRVGCGPEYVVVLVHLILAVHLQREVLLVLDIRFRIFDDFSNDMLHLACGALPYGF